MPDFSRRQFLRRASYGAAATGVLAAGGAGLIEAVGSGTAGASALAAGSGSKPVVDGSDVFAHVVDARSGEMTIFVGTKAVSYKSQALAQQILRASQ